jgi:hypothetical protein
MLKTTVDLLLRVIAVQPNLTRAEAQGILEEARGMALRLFPDKGATFELIYAPRFDRAIRERFGAGPEL